MQVWKYDYASRCDCADDDNCGCTSPGNLAHGYTLSEVKSSKKHTCLGVGSRAINFSAPAVLADGSITDIFNFFDYIENKYALLVFYAADFSAICPLDITAFNQACDELENRSVKVVAVSVDSVSAHAAWRKMSFAEGGIGQVKFPLVSDLSKDISTEYGVLRTDGMAQRATFLIDKNFTIKYQAIYDQKIERNLEETMRVVEKLIALDEAECRGLECLTQGHKTAITAQI